MKTFLSITFVLSLFVVITTGTTVKAYQGESAQQKAVLITGTSSGFGRASTEFLSSKGHFVYAGVLNEEEAKIWADNPNVKALILDVTDVDEIAAAVKVVESEGRGLYGLVNNAGIAVIGGMIEMSEDDFDWQQNVNLYGPYRITKAFAPLIIESKGRISHVSSISGILSGPTLGAYSISKHGLEAYGDTLAAEMAKFDVSVSLIEPGTYRTSIGEATLERMREQGHSLENSDYKEEMEGTLGWIGSMKTNAGDPMEVVLAIEASLFEPNPKRRYLVAPDERSAVVTIKQLLRETLQLNDRQRYSFTDEELMEFIKEIRAEN